MGVWQAIILGVVQGIGEFLPISSSAHLILVPWLLGWPASGLAFDVALHMGTLVAVVLYFWRDLLDLLRAGIFEGWRTQQGRLAWGILAATIPGAMAGVWFEEAVSTVLRSPLVIALNLAVVGVLLFLADRFLQQPRPASTTGVADVVYMGLAQALAVMPGVSRSGITMSAGLLRRLDRTSAARISFLLSFPIIFGAGVWELRHLQPTDLTAAFWSGVITAGLVGYGSIHFLLSYLRRGSYFAFAAYRVGLAAIVVTAYFYGLR